MTSLEDLKRELAERQLRVDALDRELSEKREQQRLAARPVLCGGRRLDVWMFVDDMSEVSIASGGASEEYAQIEHWFRYKYGNEIAFRRGVEPYGLTGRRPDVYVMDIGGLAVNGCGGLADSMAREMVRQAQDHPSTVFVLWSQYTSRMYADFAQNEFGLAAQENVLADGRDNLAAAIASKLGG